MDTSLLTITSALELLSSGAIKPSSLLEACQDQIRLLNPQLNAFITVCDVNRETLTGFKEPAGLQSIPIAIKDLYDLSGYPTTAGTQFFNNNFLSTDADTVSRLKNSGAVIVGKTNTHELALGVTNVNPHYGPCRNPHDPNRISGGSSGGSAVAVATGMSLGALGTDTGGSIRIPASLCGVVGLKPTYGRVSLRGIMPLSWNLDHAGPITKTVRDAALMLQVIAGYDHLDPGSINQPVDDYLANIDDGVKGWRVALAVGKYIEAAEPDVNERVNEAARRFSDLGASIIKVELDWLHAAAQANGQMVQADAAAFHQNRMEEHPDWFGSDVRQRLEAGRALSSTEYAIARRVQVEAARQLENFFADYDILLTPTTPVPAPFIEGEDAVTRARQLTRFTAPFNLTGFPALSVPCGQVDNLPVGLQIIAAHWQEAKILQAGNAYERSSNT